MRIQIVKDGPYLVTGGIPLREMIIRPKGHGYELVEGRALPQSEEYHLCRCGKSTDAPFCTGTHAQTAFDGKETASKALYKDRIADVIEGETMVLLDDDRCAYARFCHREKGNVWELTQQDADPQSRKEAIIAANECPAGRLTMVDLNGRVLEKELRPEIIVLQDPQQRVSAGIFVRGPVVIESADGTQYEVRNRVALCRCGKSNNKPFCDAAHVNARFVDRREKIKQAEYATR